MLLGLCSFAQYCGNSGAAICTPGTSMTVPGITPTSQSIAPLSSGQSASVTLHIKMPDSTYTAQGNTIQFDSFYVDSIVNLPSGMCYATNKAGNRFAPREEGCIVLSGTPCDINGQYKPRIYFTALTHGLFGGSYLPIEASTFGYKCFIRLKNASDPATNVDTTQTDANPIISYGTVPACTPSGYYLHAAKVGSDSVCDGSSVQITVLTNLPLSNNNRFYLKVTCTQTGTCHGIHYSDTVVAHQNGTFTFSLPDSITNYAFDCADHDLFNLYLESSDTATETSLGTIMIYGAAAVNWLPSGGVICYGNSVQVGGASACSQSYKWYQEPSHTLISTASAPYTILPSQTTHYSVHVTRNVCSLDSTFTLTVVPNPTFAPFDTVIATCPHDSVTIGPASIHYLESITWGDNNGFFALGNQVTVLPPFSDTYTATLYDSNSCWVQSNVSVSIKEPPYQNICMVTVDSTSNHNVVIWEKVNKPATDSFYIYREISTGNYAKIGAVLRDSLSEYHDYGANPNSTGYRYRISALDTCGNEGAQSFYHNSIHLQYLGGGNLQWNDYEIEFTTTPVASYDVLRDNNGTGTWASILNVSGTQNTASDANFASYPNARYKVASNWSYSCTPARSIHTSLSNSVTNQATSILDISESGFAIHPNPAHDVVSLSFNVPTSGLITVTDITGKEIMSQMIDNRLETRLNIAHLPSGIYVASLKTHNTVQSRKIIKD